MGVDPGLTAVCKERVLARIEPGRIPSDDAVCREIDVVLTEVGRQYMLSLREKKDLRKALFDSLRGLDILQVLLEDETVTEIMVNGTEGIFYEREGELYRWEQGFAEPERIDAIIHRIAARVNRVVNEARPILDARLADGSRVHAVLPPVSLTGPILTIRKFGREPMGLSEMVAKGSLTEEAAHFLGICAGAGYNIFVSGGTGSGKTTFLNALAMHIPADERVITIEDSAELQIKGVPNLVRLETRPANLEGDLAISIRDLIRAALRMRPTRIIVGEVRGGEALDLLQACNTGHRGCFGTAHANSIPDMISRLETMAMMGEIRMPVQAIRKQIASALEIFVQLERFPDGSRRVVSVMEVCGYEEEQERVRLSPLFELTGVDGPSGEDGRSGEDGPSGEEGPSEEGRRSGEGRLVRCGELCRREKWDQYLRYHPQEGPEA